MGLPLLLEFSALIQHTLSAQTLLNRVEQTWHVFTSTSAKTHFDEKDLVHLPSDTSSLLTPSQLSLLRLLFPRLTASASLSLSLSPPSLSLTSLEEIIKRANVQLRTAPDSKLGEKRAEVVKVSRRSDHLYKSCAVKR